MTRITTRQQALNAIPNIQSDDSGAYSTLEYLLADEVVTLRANMERMREQMSRNADDLAQAIGERDALSADLNEAIGQWRAMRNQWNAETLRRVDAEAALARIHQTLIEHRQSARSEHWHIYDGLIAALRADTDLSAAAEVDPVQNKDESSGGA